jgi:predicted ester cyclase
MPQPVTNVYQADIHNLMNPGSEKRQSMRGFDDEFVDLPDYIVRITHKIWEERAIGLIYNYYNHNAIMHSDYGTTHGVEAVVVSTLQYQAAFPSDKGFADDVIWRGNDEDGFYSSHRWTNVGTHTGYSSYGAPTGRQVIRTGFADCCVRENRIYEEWVVRDGSSMLRQMGIDPKQYVADLVKTGAYDWMRAEPHGDIERLRGQLPPPIMPPKQSEGFDVQDFVRRSYHEIWNWRLINQVEAYYAENHVAHLPDDRELHGRADIAYFITCMLAMFPDGAMEIDHFAALGNDAEGYRVAIRWTFQGTHQGHGIYGAPTNKRIRMTGISHHHIENGQYVQEWTLFDEIALLLQLAI